MIHEFRSRGIDGDSVVEEIDVVLVHESTVREAEEWASACERCAENAAIPFDYVLDAITGSDPVTTDYIMCRLAACPRCGRAVTEKTLVVA